MKESATEEYYIGKHMSYSAPVDKPLQYRLHEGLHKSNRPEDYTVTYNPATKTFTFNSRGYITDIHEDEIEPVTGTNNIYGSTVINREYNQGQSMLSTAIDLAL